MQQPRATLREKFRDGHKIVVRGVQLCAIQVSHGFNRHQRLKLTIKLAPFRCAELDFNVIAMQNVNMQLRRNLAQTKMKFEIHMLDRRGCVNTKWPGCMPVRRRSLIRSLVNRPSMDESQVCSGSY